MPAPLRIHLTPEEDAQLRELETNPVVPHKVRRRAQAVRLAAQGWTAPRIARHLGLDHFPAGGSLGGAVLHPLPSGDGAAEAPGPGVPVGANAVRAGGDGVAAGEGVVVAAAVLRERGGGEARGGGGVEKTAGAPGEGSGAKSMQGYLSGSYRARGSAAWRFPPRTSMRMRE